MASPDQRIVLLRHGQTEWSVAGKHTGRTDVALTADGEAQAAAVAGRLPDGPYDLVLTSPLRRAADTARLAGFPDAEPDPDLLEWDYGTVEGRTTAEIRRDQPTWDIWRDGAPGGEAVDAIGERVDRVIARTRAVEGSSLLVAHAHVLRVLAARWLGLPPEGGRYFPLDTTHWSVLAWQRETAVISTWNVGSP